MSACNVQSCVVQCCGVVSVFFVVKWVTWHRTLPCMPASKKKKNTRFPRSLTDGYAMLISPSKGETAVHGCLCPRGMAMRMCEVMARPWVGVCVSLVLIYS